MDETTKALETISDRVMDHLLHAYEEAITLIDKEVKEVDGYEKSTVLISSMSVVVAGVLHKMYGDQSLEVSDNIHERINEAIKMVRELATGTRKPVKEKSLIIH